MSGFPCTTCGECCKKVNLSAETSSLDRGDGTCVYFDTKTNLCSIYEDRPNICRVDYQYEKHYKQLLSWDDFVSVNLKACKEIKNL